MRYPTQGHKTYIQDLLQPGIAERGDQGRCFVRVGADPNEATLSLAVDIDRDSLTHDRLIISGVDMPEGLRPRTHTDGPMAVAGGGQSFIRIQANGGVVIMSGWPGFADTSWQWLIGTFRYERGAQ